MAAKRTTHGSLILRGNRLFALRNQPPKQQPFLIVLPFPGQPSDARVLVDPNEMDKKSHVAIDWFVPSPDGKLVAVSLSKGGSESGDVHIFDVSSGKQVDAVIPRVQNGTAAGYLAWSADGKGFYYTRYPHGNERPAADTDFFQQLYFHELGTTSEKDRYEIGKEFPRIAEVQARGRAQDRPRARDGAERRQRRVRTASSAPPTASGCSSPTSRTALCRRRSARMETSTPCRARMRRAARSSGSPASTRTS